MGRINTTSGYDPFAGRMQGTPKGHNARLRTEYNSKANGEVRLWVQDVQTGFALNGSDGQSQDTRSYFPRNRIQQSIVVSCQFPNQTLYADALEWIHERQRDKSTSLSLWIFARKMPVKGKGEDIHAYGYIKNVMRKHERFVYAPELNFEFLVKRLAAPSGWRDSQETVKMTSLPSWKDVIEKYQTFRDDPDAASEDAVGIDPKDDPDLTTDFGGGLRPY